MKIQDLLLRSTETKKFKKYISHWCNVKKEEIRMETIKEAFDLLEKKFGRSIEEMYQTVNDTKIVEVYNTDTSKLKKIAEQCRKAKVLPVELITDNRILVVDYSYLPREYKFDTSDETKEFLEDRYNCRVLLIDSSRSNLEGVSRNNINPPIYFA